MSAINMPAGHYYIGDPCYVLDREAREEFRASIHRPSGIAAYGGVPSVSFYTKYGDGLYWDDYGYEYSVDSASIGAVPVALISDDPEVVERKAAYGQLHHFPSDFECENVNGHLRFGRIVINTDI